MTQILIDSVASLAVHNGVLRIECKSVGPDGQQHTSGSLIIPGAVAGQVLESLIRGTQELEKKLREQQTVGSAPAEAEPAPAKKK